MRKILCRLFLLVCIASFPLSACSEIALENEIWNELSRLLDPTWEIVTVSVFDESRIHVCVRDTQNDQFSKEWKIAVPHTDISKLCANAAFACAEIRGGGYWVSVAVQDKTVRTWESYRWREYQYRDGCVTTSGFLNEF